MKNKLKNPLISLFLIIGLYLITSCSESENNSTAEFKSLSQNDSTMIMKINDLYLSFPSPYEILSMVDKSKIQYNPNLLNSVESSGFYKTQTKKILNLGIYSSDIAYQVLLKNNTTLSDYINIAGDLISDLELNTPITEADEKKILDYYNNFDTLVDLTNNRYTDMVNTIIESNDYEKYFLLSLGAMVETFYLFSSAIPASQFSVKNCRLIEQKKLFEDVYSQLELYKSSSLVKPIYNDIQRLKNAFNKIAIEEINSNLQEIKKGQYFLQSDRNVVCSVSTYNTLKSTIHNIRNNWIKP